MWRSKIFPNPSLLGGGGRPRGHGCRGKKPERFEKNIGDDRWPSLKQRKRRMLLGIVPRVKPTTTDRILFSGVEASMEFKPGGST